ncbi:hypothetical protein OSTOST_22587 [Ostertagia ostertagi]
MLCNGLRCQRCSETEKGHLCSLWHGNFCLSTKYYTLTFLFEEYKCLSQMLMLHRLSFTFQVYKCDLEKIAHRLLNYDGSHYQLHVYAVNHYEGPIANISTWPYEMVNATNFWLGDFPSMQRLMYPNAPYMGCAYTTKSRHGRPWLKVVCVFEDMRHPWDPFMPKPSGKPCKTDSNCRKFGWNFECARL